MSGTFYDNTLKPALLYGAMLAGVLIVFSLVTDLFLLTFNTTVTTIQSVLTLAALVFIIYVFRKVHNGNVVSYGKALGFGVLVATIVGFITSAFLILNIEYITPDYLERMTVALEEQLLDKGLSEDLIELSIEQRTKFMTPVWIMVFGTLGTAVNGLVISLIAAIFIKREPSNPFQGVE
jgi:hypothetical protein